MTIQKKQKNCNTLEYPVSKVIYKNLNQIMLGSASRSVLQICEGKVLLNYTRNFSVNSRSGAGGDFYDVLVVGGGIMGSSTAHWLTRRNKNIKVGVIECDPSYNTSATTLSVGGLRQQFSLDENIQIGLYARDFMRNYPASLFEGSTVPSSSVPDVKFQPHGYLFLASEAGYDILKENNDTQIRNGADIALLTSEQLRRKFPWLLTDGVVAGCYGGDNEGWFDPWALLQAFKISAMNRGAEFVTGRAQQFANVGGKPSKVNKNFKYGYIVCLRLTSRKYNPIRAVPSKNPYSLHKFSIRTFTYIYVEKCF